MKTVENRVMRCRARFGMLSVTPLFSDGVRKWEKTMADTVLRSPVGGRSLVMAALGYVSVLVFVPLLMARDDEFATFHARQGLVIWMSGVFALFALHIPVLGKWLFGSVSWAVFAFSALGLVSVLLRRAWKLPLVGAIAERI